MAHTTLESENRLAPLGGSPGGLPREPPVDLEEAGQARRLKASGVRLSCCLRPRIGEFVPNPTEPYPYRYLLKELTTATTTITPRSTSAQIASFEIWSRAQSIIAPCLSVQRRISPFDGHFNRYGFWIYNTTAKSGHRAAH